jgi:hypothetical protein
MILELHHPSDRRIEKNEELLASYIDTWEASLADHTKRQVQDSSCSFQRDAALCTKITVPFKEAIWKFILSVYCTTEKKE